ncbi:hypothetical protein GY45DRAFT_959313 [Cubamyces sp. BRFM 1775]|nr:hypothetical protein GY45DRAFT_959313 [Cubamyces sp. BRFM 1775]
MLDTQRCCAGRHLTSPVVRLRTGLSSPAALLSPPDHRSSKVRSVLLIHYHHFPSLAPCRHRLAGHQDCVCPFEVASPSLVTLLCVPLCSREHAGLLDHWQWHSNALQPPNVSRVRSLRRAALARLRVAVARAVSIRRLLRGGNLGAPQARSMDMQARRPLLFPKAVPVPCAPLPVWQWHVAA